VSFRLIVAASTGVSILIVAVDVYDGTAASFLQAGNETIRMNMNTYVFIVLIFNGLRD
jgi:hypothetical protein